MNTVGWVFILLAALLVRGMTKGRTIAELPGDMSDLFTAFVTGDTAKVSEVLARKGDGQDSATSDPFAGIPAGKVSGNIAVAPPGAVGATLLDEVKRLGSGAHYQWGGTGGGNGYDCSGLIWRAMKNKGIYTGIRFTTLTFAIMCKRNIEPIFFPGVGDIVVWRDHMGIVDGPNSFYSALSSRSGIKSTPIKSHAGQPQYYRIWTPDKASISSGFSGGLEGNPGKAKDNVIP